MITIVVNLDQETEQEARSRGLLTSETVARLIEDALRQQKRQEALRQTRAILAQLDALEPALSEAEIAEELRKPPKQP